MKDLAVGIAVTAKSGQAVAELRRLKGGIDDVKQSATSATPTTGNLGKAARESSADLARMADSADNVSTKGRALSAVADALGLDLGNMAGGARGATAALGEATGVVGGLSTAATVAIGSVAALGAGFVAAVSIAESYKDRVAELTGQIALAGQQSSFTAASLTNDAQRIAGEAGQSFNDVQAALIGLVSSQKNTAAESLALAEAGANLAATFSLDVAKATDLVSEAFNALGEGDVKALENGFGFLDAETRRTIITLAGLGQTAAAQQKLLEALSDTVDGGKGSVSSSFGNASAAVFDYAGQLLSSIPAIQSVSRFLQGLAKDANAAAGEIRRALVTKENARLGELQQELADAKRQRARVSELTNVKPVFLDRKIAGLEIELREEAKRRAPALANVRGGSNSGFNGDKTAAEEAKLVADFEKFKRDRTKIAATPRTPRAAASRSSGQSSAAREAERKAAQEQREAAAAARELANDLAGLTRTYEPLVAAQQKYAETLATITKLQSASAGVSRISAEQAERFKAGALAELEATKEAARKESVEPLIKDITDKLSGASREGARVLKDEGIASAQAVAKALGGGLGREASDFIGLLRGAKTGDFTSVQGKLGGFLTLLAGRREGEDPSGIAKGAAEFGRSIEKAISRPLDKIFGEGGLFSRSLGSELGTVSETLGTALAGAGFGKAATNFAGVRGSKTGAAIGAVAGKATGIPLADVVGAAIGSFVVGGLKKAKKGSAAVSFADGSFSAGDAVGNSSSLRGQASALAGSIAGRIETIAETLGGFLSGRGSVSIGSRNGKAVVDPTGRNRTKGAGVINFGKGEEGQAKAEAFALANLIADGAIDGLSDKVAAALRGSTDIDKAVREAIKVDELEQLLAGFGAGTRKALVDFERQAKGRLRIATKFGFDVVRVEEETAKQRKALNDQLLEERTGSLKALLEDFALGDRSTGSLADRRAGLLARIKGLEGSAATDAATASKLADLLGQFDAISLEANGTAGGQFAADRAQASEIAQRIIDQATREIEAAAAAARANAGTASTDNLIKTGNATLSTIAGGIEELGALTSQMVSALGRITANTAAANKTDPFAAALLIGGKVV